MLPILDHKRKSSMFSDVNVKKIEPHMFNTD
jgi:hypothetical protein